MAFIADCPLWVGRCKSFPEIRLPCRELGCRCTRASDNCATRLDKDNDDAAFTFDLPRFLGCGSRPVASPGASSDMTTAAALARTAAQPPPQLRLYRRYWAVVMFSAFEIDYELLFLRLLPPEFWLGVDNTCGGGVWTLHPPRFIFLHDYAIGVTPTTPALKVAVPVWHRWLLQQLELHRATAQWVGSEGAAPGAQWTDVEFQAFEQCMQNRFSVFNPSAHNDAAHCTEAIFAFTRDPLFAADDPPYRQTETRACVTAPQAVSPSQATLPVPIPDGVRLIIGTSSLMGDGFNARHGQMVYCQDFPRMRSSTAVNLRQSAAVQRQVFGVALKEYLSTALSHARCSIDCSNSDPGIWDRTRQYVGTLRYRLPGIMASDYDYSTAAALIVPSFPGVHHEAAQPANAMCPPLQARTLRELATREGLRLDFVAAAHLDRPYLGVWGAHTALILCEALATKHTTPQASSGTLDGVQEAPAAAGLQRALVWQCPSKGALPMFFVEEVARALAYPHPEFRFLETPATAKPQRDDFSRRRARSPALEDPAIPAPQSPYQYSSVMPHNRTLLHVVRQETRPVAQRIVPVNTHHPALSEGYAEWVMPTSADLTCAAWGDPQRFAAQLSICAYALGVVVHPALLPPTEPLPPPPLPAALPEIKVDVKAEDCDADDKTFGPLSAAARLARCGTRVASFLTPDHPLHVPGSLCAEAIDFLRTRFGLHAVALGAPPSADAAEFLQRRVVFLPWDPIRPQQYDVKPLKPITPIKTPLKMSQSQPLSLPPRYQQ